MTKSVHLTPLKIAVLISGGGTTLKNLIDKITSAQLNARIELVISSDMDARGLEFARQADISTLVVSRRECASSEEFKEKIFDPCRMLQVDLVVMAGFLKHVPIPPDFTNRVMNIHPSLIPSFCGRGYYGHYVHEAVLEHGVKLSGCTVHFVDNHYDHGPIILQRSVPVLQDDTPESLAKRVFAEECEAYPQALRWFAEGRLSVQGRVVKVRE